MLLYTNKKRTQSGAFLLVYVCSISCNRWYFNTCKYRRSNLRFKRFYFHSWYNRSLRNPVNIDIYRKSHLSVTFLCSMIKIQSLDRDTVY